MTEWIDWLKSVSDREPAALVSVLACEGSAPRGPGTRMLVTASGQRGTIGGGQLEFRAVEQARLLLERPHGSWRIQDYPLGPLLGQCCGGRVRLLLEHLDPIDLDWTAEEAEGRLLSSTLREGRVERRFVSDAFSSPTSARGERPCKGASFVEAVGQHCRSVYLFGAGHVGQAVARHSVNLPLHLAWFDTRPVFESIEGVTVVPEESIEQCVVEAPEDAAIVIMTHDHGIDYRLTLAALQRPDPVAFVGLIGSSTKRARFHSKLEQDGVSPDARARLTSPIGVEGVRGKEPDVIAIATVAQLLQLRNL